jgi:hypothetical protein
MGKKMLVKYYKYRGEKYGERKETERRRKYKGDQTFNFVVFYCVAIDPMYKLSNYVKVSTVVMFGDEKGDKLWATVNTYFRAIFEDYREMYAPSDKAPQPTDTSKTLARSKRLMRSIIAQ